MIGLHIPVLPGLSPQVLVSAVACRPLGRADLLLPAADAVANGQTGEANHEINHDP